MAQPYPPAAWDIGMPDDWFIVVPADGQLLYRLVGREEPRLRDFQSWRDRDQESGREARYPKQAFIDYTSLSMFETAALAVESANIFPAYVASVRLEAENGFSLARTEAGIDGHYGVWGDPEKLLVAVEGPAVGYAEP